jgi:hypothetical protein
MRAERPSQAEDGAVESQREERAETECFDAGAVHGRGRLTIDDCGFLIFEWKRKNAPCGHFNNQQSTINNRQSSINEPERWGAHAPPRVVSGVLAGNVRLPPAISGLRWCSGKSLRRGRQRRHARARVLPAQRARFFRETRHPASQRGCVPPDAHRRTEPRGGSIFPSPHRPRVAVWRRQPWAGRRNAVGVADSPSVPAFSGPEGSPSPET